MRMVMARREVGEGVILQADTWGDPKIRLFINDMEANPALPLADFTPATFTGSADKTLTLPTALDYVGSTEVILPCAPVLFVNEATEDPAETVYGALIYDGTLTIAVARFDEPILIGDIGDHIYVTPELWP